MRTLVTTAEAGQQSLVQAYLPLLEQWEAEEPLEAPATDLRRPISVWLVLASCLNRWRTLVLGQWSLARVQACLPRLRRFFCCSPRRRLHQRLWFQAWIQQRFLATQVQGSFP